MFRMKRNKCSNSKGQSMAEFVTIIIIVLGAFVSAQIYIKRGLQGRWKAAIDDLGDQYDPLAANSNFYYRMVSSANTSVITMNSAEGLWSKRTDRSISTERKEGYFGSGPYNFFE